MNLNNSTKETAEFNVDTSNGRVATIKVTAGASIDEDLSKYRPPFALSATVDGSSASPLSGLDGTEKVTLLEKGSGYMLMDSF